jgi:hypothetical protein
MMTSRGENMVHSEATPEHSPALEKVAAILRPGGRLVLAVVCTPTAAR